MKRILPCLLMLSCFPASASTESAAPVPALTTAPAAASSMTLTVAGKPVVLALPEGACAYDRTQLVDAKLLAFLEKGNEGINQVLLAFADCADLDAMRQGRPVMKGYYGQVLSAYSTQSAADTYSRTAYVREMTQQYDTAAAQQGVDTARERVKTILSEKVDVGDVKMLGLINKEPELVQMGMVQSALMPDGNAQKIDGVITMTKLGVPVSINLYHADAGASSWTELNARSVAYVHALIALNADIVLPHADERGENWDREGVIVGLCSAVLGSISLYIYRKKRRKL